MQALQERLARAMDGRLPALFGVEILTIELKTNFLGTATEGALRCDARLVHGGSRTQVWDATVRREQDERVIALFRCTQFILPAHDPRTTQQQRARGLE